MRRVPPSFWIAGARAKARAFGHAAVPALPDRGSGRGKRRILSAAGLVLIALAFASAAESPPDLRSVYAGPTEDWPAPWLEPGVTFAELAPLALHPRPAPGSREAALADLGQHLFMDPQLSASGSISCASCHDPVRGWGDGQRVSTGHDGAEGRRNAPGLHSAGYRRHLFWDGRAARLEDQALGPLLNPIEMANDDLAEMIAKLSSDPDYPPLFFAAYGTGSVTLERLTGALAAFQSGLEAPTRLDHFLSGEQDALSDAEISGLHLFRTKAGCINCHGGPLLTDEGFHNLGLGLFGRRYHDMGRFEVTGDPADAGKFRTPSLRHVAETAPYMHNGLVPDLDKVLLFYKSGGGRSMPRDAAEAADPVFQGAARTSPLLRKLELTPEEWADLRAFLDAV